MNNWVDFPDGENLPRKMKYRRNNLLLRYQDNTTTKIHDLEKQKYKRLVNLIGSDNAELRLEIIKIISDYTVTQVGSQRDFSENIDERFEHNCDNCNNEQKFQLMGLYRSVYAKCTNCGHEISVFITNCENCDKESVFLSEHSINSPQRCYKCNRRLTEND